MPVRLWLYAVLGVILGLVLQAGVILATPWVEVLAPPVLGAVLFLLAKLGGDGLLFFWNYDLWKVLSQKAVEGHLLFGLVGLVAGLAAVVAETHVGGEVNLVWVAVLSYLLLVAQTTRVEGRIY